MILSCADAIGHVLEQGIADFEGTADSAGDESSKIKYTGLDLGFCPQCPQCGTILVHEEGCAVCKTCGYSKCG